MAAAATAATPVVEKDAARLLRKNVVLWHIPHFRKHVRARSTFLCFFGTILCLLSSFRNRACVGAVAVCLYHVRVGLVARVYGVNLLLSNSLLRNLVRFGKPTAIGARGTIAETCRAIAQMPAVNLAPSYLRRTRRTLLSPRVDESFHSLVSERTEYSLLVHADEPFDSRAARTPSFGFGKT